MNLNGVEIKEIDTISNDWMIVEYNGHEQEAEYILKFMMKIANAKSYLKINHEDYLNIDCGLDIETTNMGNYGFMYCCCLAMQIVTPNLSKRVVLIFRKWDDVFNLLKQMNELATTRFIIWIANMDFELTFMAPWFDEVFGGIKLLKRNGKDILKATSGKIEMRDCLEITNSNLKNTAKMCCKTQKTTYDFSKVRNSLTPMTPEEIAYSSIDAVICAEFMEFMKNNFIYKKGESFPLTSTAIIRNKMKNKAAKSKCKKITPEWFPNWEDYQNEMKYLLAGGVLYANNNKVGDTINNVLCFDERSAYIRVLLAKKFPMSKFEKCDISEIDNLNSNYGYKMIVRLDNVNCKGTQYVIKYDKILSSTGRINIINGSVIDAESIYMMITDIDLENFRLFYTFDIVVLSLEKAELKKLPSYVTEPLIDAYREKQTTERLRNAFEEGTPEREDLNSKYKWAKVIATSIYGCMLQKIHIPSGADAQEVYQEEIQKRCLSPYWGIWCTAYARQILCQIIADAEAIEKDCTLYSDTDSIYIKDTPELIELVKSYNDRIYAENQKVLPQDILTLGMFKFEGECTRFKMLGKKKYLKEVDGQVKCCVSGLTDVTFKRLCDGKTPEQIFDDVFNNDLSADAIMTDLHMAEYTRKEYEMEVTDYLGNTETMKEKGGVAITGKSFSLGQLVGYVITKEFEKVRIS